MKRMCAAILALLLISTAVSAQAIIGTEIGNFTVETGDGKKMPSSDLSGKITVLFYETKDNTELNRTAKGQLNDLFDTLSSEQKRDVIRLPVIDCSAASWPFMSIWKNKLMDNAKMEGMDIYGDWDGSLKPLFSFDNKKAYVLIIDRSGTVRFFEEGQLPQSKIDLAKSLLLSLL